MCSNPITQDDKTFACRSCNECIATRRAQWEARAMMEKALHPFTLAIAFTYDESTQANRDARAMFQYKDMRDFLGRLRAAARYKNPDAYVRFICAGEQGDKRGHCHWHVIIYSNVDPCSLGEVKRLKNGKRVVETNRDAMLTTPDRKVRLNWSLWPQGFVTMQDADYGGCHYVLSYCLMDQFTEEKSRGTMREGKSSNFSTGLFRMSKRPAIGEPWLWRQFERLEQIGAVKPDLNFKIPGVNGYYHPSGTFREKILWSLVALNKRHVWATGRNAPQWPALLAAVKDNPSDLDILNGTIFENKQIKEELAFEFPHTAGAGDPLSLAQTRLANLRRTRPECVGALPCKGCLGKLSDEKLQTLGVVRKWAFEGAAAGYVYRAAPGFAAVEERQGKDVGRPNPYCEKRGRRFVVGSNPVPFEPDRRRR